MELPQITRVSAYGLLTDHGRLLLCRISGQVPKLAGRWTLPGGQLEFGEDPVDAMRREVHEETGLDVRMVKLLGLYSNRVATPDALYHGIRIVYRAEKVGGALRNELDGTTDLCAWKTRDEASALRLVDLARIGLDLALPE